MTANNPNSATDKQLVSDETNQLQYVERSDVGVSITVELKRGTGTRDQDKLTGKIKARTLEDARADMDVLREYLHTLAVDTRQIQPAEELDVTADGD